MRVRCAKGRSAESRRRRSSSFSRRRHHRGADPIPHHYRAPDFTDSREPREDPLDYGLSLVAFLGASWGAIIELAVWDWYGAAWLGLFAVASFVVAWKSA